MTGDGWVTAVEIGISRSSARERERLEVGGLCKERPAQGCERESVRGGRVVRGGGGSGWLGKSWDGEKERDQRKRVERESRERAEKESRGERADRVF
jgi:hypothetical protein